LFIYFYYFYGEHWKVCGENEKKHINIQAEWEKEKVENWEKFMRRRGETGK